MNIFKEQLIIGSCSSLYIRVGTPVGEMVGDLVGGGGGGEVTGTIRALHTGLDY